MRIGESGSNSAVNAVLVATTHPRKAESPTAPSQGSDSIAPPFRLGGEAEHSIDFNNATRQELADWLNEQVRSGRMTLKESGSFLAMTLKYSHATGHHVDMASDHTRVDFMERARAGIDGALSRFDYEGAERWRHALAVMRHHQTATAGVDLLA
jgi:hypothetical protein